MDATRGEVVLPLAEAPPALLDVTAVGAGPSVGVLALADRHVRQPHQQLCICNAGAVGPCECINLVRYGALVRLPVGYDLAETRLLCDVMQGHCQHPLCHQARRLARRWSHYVGRQLNPTVAVTFVEDHLRSEKKREHNFVAPTSEPPRKLLQTKISFSAPLEDPIAHRWHYVPYAQWPEQRVLHAQSHFPMR